MKLSRRFRLRAVTILLLLAALLLSACSSENKPIQGTDLEMTVIGQCEGYDIYYEELRYLTLSYRDIMKNYYGDDIWNDPATAEQYLPELTEYVMNNLTANYAILAKCQPFGIDINHEAIQEAVQQSIDEIVDDLGGKKEYKEALKALYLTDHLVRFTVGADYCQTELMYSLQDIDVIISKESDFLSYAQDGGFCAVYHIYIGNDEGDSVEENRARAEEVLAKIQNGTSFEQLIGSIYNEDVYMTNTPYYFTYGEYDQAYEDAAFALEIGEVSDIVETEDGFYILKRQPLDQDYLVANLQELMQRYQYAQVDLLIRDYQETIAVELNDFGKSLDLLAIQME